MTAIEFNTQLEKIHKQLNRFAYHLTMNSENARDLVQDTFCRALQNRDKFREDVNFKAWAFTIMRNIFINEYRKGQKYKMVDQEPDHYSLTSRFANHDVPDSRLHMRQVSDAISLLEDDYRTPLQMHIQGYKYIEIAEMLNVKMGTVKSRIFLSRKKLGEMLAEHRDNNWLPG
ncbi:RNA polymerase sigma-70 factor (ECF subfamily) [Breznakibacter xylanolyticus]|uniref:RNA polymerase sigma-70 factor (ECF subfamily) n=1 Tax=Breznakibacter xylanolyticus TaxID=990 RepID=A0A2W7MZY2_9BACT|nr:sigma-70 family RNA polymerase sigma factor [Breznakibacter xylanolyticus]PZX10144.1 RNA polymerase sigma-70 factor (ECF subfamily) [Breznakibacter xylanolyticus]